MFTEMFMEEKFKVLKIENIEEIIEFENICFQNDTWKKSDWIDLLNDERAIYLAQLDDRKIISNIFLYNWEGEKDFLKIMQLSVHPDYRGEQRARKLLNEAIKIASKYHLKRILAETRESNSKMRYVFDDMGFTAIDKADNYYQNPNEAAIKYSYQIF